MGQAKARGSKEQRIAEGIEKARLREVAFKKELAERKRKDVEYLESLSEDERVKVLARRRFFSTLMMGNLNLI